MRVETDSHRQFAWLAFGFLRYRYRYRKGFVLSSKEETVRCLANSFLCGWVRGLRPTVQCPAAPIQMIYSCDSFQPLPGTTSAPCPHSCSLLLIKRSCPQSRLTWSVRTLSQGLWCFHPDQVSVSWMEGTSKREAWGQRGVPETFCQSCRHMLTSSVLRTRPRYVLRMFSQI